MIMAESPVILTSSSYSTAQIILTKLESFKIECFLKNVNLIQPTIGEGVQIFVKNSDLEQAFELLQEFFAEIKFPTHSFDIKNDLPHLFVVPVDFSQVSENACYFAIDLAILYNARVKLIHAYHIPDIRPISFDDADFYQAAIVNQLIDMRQEAELKFNLLTANIKSYMETKKTAVPVASYLINGSPEEITLYSAENENAGLIILGISKSDMRSFEPMGKIATHISDKAEIPVLVIPEESKFTGIQQIKNVLYLTDFDESDFAAIQTLFTTIRLLRTKVFCLHISNEIIDQWDKIKINGLVDYFHKIDPSSDIECDLIVSKDILKALDEFIVTKNIHLIAITTHKQNLISKILIPSVSHKILFHTKIPILIFHG
jgi:nucleotide-binding universal stress UspA family protein